jgi:hypothetical protein
MGRGLSTPEERQLQTGGVKNVKGCLHYVGRMRQKPAKRSGKVTAGTLHKPDAFRNVLTRRNSLVMT